MKPLPSPRVLLVEDDPISRAFMSVALEAVPAEVDSADSLAAALALANAQDYALWLFDANLPDGSGVELLARLRHRHPHTPAIAHTASDDKAVLDTLAVAGFARVLVKPLPSATLQRAVRSVLGLGDAVGQASRDEPQADPPAWDDEAAALALNGNRAHIATLRGLFVHELPHVRERIRADARSGDLDSVRASLHKLRASCGFVGAARLGVAVRELHHQADSPVLLARFVDAAQDTLAEYERVQDVPVSG
ncbi:response regulator [Lysobacter koreensis]|uniref:Response regulator n=1 Tax=Lysobacter koreensis TaxID=266122 RepID=A0ABW2YKA3_9GAMM